ncbi:MAG TPA: FAD-binding oxidoreductase [Acidimicrobiales bacterium]|nr:FAD-binding oxidoreductase [Acidimicrobiales bacterium]
MVVGVRAECRDATALLLELPEPVDFVAGQYFLVRVRADVVPAVVEEAYSVSSSSSWPLSSTIEITFRDVPGGRVSPLLARRVNASHHLHLLGRDIALLW